MALAIDELPKGPQESKKDTTKTLPPPVAAAVDPDAAKRSESLTRFREAIAPFVPKAGAENSATQERLLGILGGALTELGGVEIPKEGAITLSKVNEELSKRGFAITVETSGTEAKPRLENIRVIEFDPKAPAERFDGNRFKELVSLTAYPEIALVTAKSQTLYHAGPRQEGLVPGQVVLRDQSSPLVLVFPEVIAKQEAIFKADKAALVPGAMTDIVRINEASHSLLEQLLGDRPVGIDGLRMPIKGPIAINLPAIDRHQFHELFSDAASLKLSKDLPSAIAMLGRQSDEGHAVSFQLLNSSTVVALHLYIQDSTAQERGARMNAIGGLVTPQENGTVHVNFDGVVAAMRREPALNALVKEIVVGAHTSVANGVLQEAFKK